MPMTKHAVGHDPRPWLEATGARGRGRDSKTGWQLMLPKGRTPPADGDLADYARRSAAKSAAEQRLAVWHTDSEVYVDADTGLRLSTSDRGRVREAVEDLRAMVDAPGVPGVNRLTALDVSLALDVPAGTLMTLAQAVDLYGRLVEHGMGVKQQLRGHEAAIAAAGREEDPDDAAAAYDAVLPGVVVPDPETTGGA